MMVEREIAQYEKMSSVEYWNPLGKLRISLQETFGKAIAERDYWFD